MHLKILCNLRLLKHRLPIKTLLIMKLIILLTVVACLHASAGGYAQKLTISKQDVSLEVIFKEIKKQTGYNFLYNYDWLQNTKKVTVEVKDASINQVLDICFKDQPLTYEIVDKTISLRKKPIAPEEKPQAFPVQGRVVNDNGDPIPGVTVTVKGTKLATSTDANGEFSLALGDQNAHLLFSGANVETFEYDVSGKAELIVKLSTKINKLDEVQVIAYGTTTERLNTGNISTVKAVDIEKQPVQNPLLALQGRVPGIEITPLSGMNGGGVTVRIQGRNSIQSGLDPLIVIDGVPFPSQLSNTGFEGIVQGGSPLNYINPTDIESIDVLKDADATAIYGSRAANGAILITTKKGKAGRTKLNINLQQGWAKVTRKLNLLNTQQYLKMRHEAFYDDSVYNPSSYSPPDPTRDYDLLLWDTTRYTDWQKKLVGGTAQYSNISAGISGGTTALQYLINGTYKRQTTVFPGNFDDKNGSLYFNFNGGSPNQKFHFNLSGSYSYDQNHLPNVDLTSQIFLAPDAPAIYNTNGTLNWAPNTAGRSTWYNPLANLNTEFNNTTKNLISNASLSYNVLPGLEIRSNLGYTTLQSELYLPTRLENNFPEDIPFSQRYSNFINRDMNSWIIEPQLHYTNRSGKGRLEGLLGATISQNTTDVLAFNASGFSSDLLMHSPSAATSITMYQTSATMSKYNALFGRLNYNWKDKYLINLTARRDGSSKFGDENKFHNFWSIGTGWIFSQETFMQHSLPFLSFGKLRASYGTTGNDQITDYSYLSLYYNSNTPIPYENATGLTVSNLPNPHLQWEETRKWQGGIELGFINDRILLNVTYAQNRSSNQLIGYSLPSVTGFTYITENLPATIRNTSWEFALNTINVKGRNFNWSSSVNLTIPENKLVSFPNISLTSYAAGDLGVIVGQPLGVVQVFRYKGIDPATGNYLVLDKNGKPTYTPDYLADRTALITPRTKYYGGFRNSVSYKGFQLDILFQFVRQLAPKDLYYFNGNDNPGYFQYYGGNQPITVLNHWQKPGDNTPIGRYTAINFSVPIWVQAPYSDAGYSYDASYIRLKNLSLSWQLPSVWLQKAHLQKARFYLSGQNLATITKYTSLDPETRSISTLPPLQLWTVGMQLEL